MRSLIRFACYVNGASRESTELAPRHNYLADCPHCTEYLREMRRTIDIVGRIGDQDVDAMPDDLRTRLLDAFREETP